MQSSTVKIFVPKFVRKLARPLVLTRVPAGFPSPADDYLEGRIDLNCDLIKHPFATFYVRVAGDSMETLISDGELLVVDRMSETKDKDVVVACVDGELCVKRLRILDDGAIWLFSENTSYQPIEICTEMEFSIWGKVLHCIQSFK